MEKKSYLPNCIIPGSEFKLSKEPLNFGISLFDPVSSVDGSPTFFFLQPLLAGRVFTSVLILIISQIIMFIFNRFWNYNLPPINKRLAFSPEQTVSMSLSDLQNFLASMACSQTPSSANQSSANQSPSTSSSTDQTPPSGVDEGEITPETKEAPLILALAVWGDFQDKDYSPSVFLLFPILTFPGVRGALPLLILELLTTIFVRSVVPPETTGAKPLKVRPQKGRQEFEGFY